MGRSQNENVVWSFDVLGDISERLQISTLYDHAKGYARIFITRLDQSGRFRSGKFLSLALKTPPENFGEETEVSTRDLLAPGAEAKAHPGGMGSLDLLNDVHRSLHRVDGLTEWPSELSAEQAELLHGEMENIRVRSDWARGWCSKSPEVRVQALKVLNYQRGWNIKPILQGDPGADAAQ